MAPRFGDFISRLCEIICVILRARKKVRHVLLTKTLCLFVFTEAYLAKPTTVELAQANMAASGIILQIKSSTYAGVKDL